MDKHKLLVIGAGRIGGGYRWHDDEYTHAGAAKALSNRVELAGFVEPDEDRAIAAELKWGVKAYYNVASAMELRLDIDLVSICVQPEMQSEVFVDISPYTRVKGIYCEKPFLASVGGFPPIQVNYLRRGDGLHRRIAESPDIKCNDGPDRYLFVTAKNDIHTRCHFEDLAKWWKAQLIYTTIDGPNSYFLRWRIATGGYYEQFFSLGGIDGGKCMKAMLTNLLDHVDDPSIPLWSPPI